MLADIKEAIVQFVTHRLFALSIVFIALMLVLVYRLFQLQIVNGEDYLENFNLMSEKTLVTEGQRGNIYDCNGNLLAYNRLTYSLTFSNSEQISEIAEQEDVSENTVKNRIIAKLITILDENGDSIVNSFDIKMNKKGNYVFRDKDEEKILAFKREVYCVSNDTMTEAQKNADAKEVFDYLRRGNKNSEMFGVSDEYDDEMALKIVAIRYMLYLNRYNQYVPVTVAMDISDKSVAAIKESSTDLPGAEIESDSVREYDYATYFSQIIGYTGVISVDEKEKMNQNLSEEEAYSGNEVIGKTGLEQRYEEVLRGKNGKQTVLVDNVGKIIQKNDDETAAVSGNDLYLTIDAELQKTCTDTLESYLAGILLAHLQNTNVKVKKGNINIPITEVYFALFNNNVIDISHLHSKKASDTETKVYQLIENGRKSVISDLKNELQNKRTAYKSLSDEKQEYMSYVYSSLKSNNIIKTADVDTDDTVYKQWKNEEISLGEFLDYSIKQNWISTAKFSISDDYYDTEEVFVALIDYIEDILSDDDEFVKLVLEVMITNGDVNGTDCCRLLYDQGVLDSEKDEDYEKLISGSLSAYNFIYKKIKNLEITPAQLALDPCSGSIVVTNVKTGEVMALASYPGYDNNRLANNLDNDYYTSLLEDKTSPFLNRCTQSSTAPGSTFKMVSSVAGLKEGVIGYGTLENCRGIYTKITPAAKCAVYPGSHGKINVVKAIEESCNVFFFEVGNKLSYASSGTFDEEQGLAKLKKYASLFGLNKVSGIELNENEPQISTQDPIRSAIGQGSNAFTPAQLARYVTTIANSGTCYNLSILDKQVDSEGNLVEDYTPSVLKKVKLEDSVWDAIHQGMYKVVHGPSHGSVFKGVYTDVAGKTGTAEEDTRRSSHALFVSYGPYEDPEISVTVVVPNGYYSSTAMEISREVYKYYYSKEEKAAAKKEKKEAQSRINVKTATIPGSTATLD